MFVWSFFTAWLPLDLCSLWFGSSSAPSTNGNQVQPVNRKAQKAMMWLWCDVFGDEDATEDSFGFQKAVGNCQKTSSKGYCRQTELWWRPELLRSSWLLEHCPPARSLFSWRCRGSRVGAMVLWRRHHKRQFLAMQVATAAQDLSSHWQMPCFCWEKSVKNRSPQRCLL